MERNLIDINELIRNSPEDAVLEAENTYHARVEEIAEYVFRHEHIRIITLAGPSGSGKTTTANLIADAIRRRGEEAIVVSLDDFYRNSDDPGYPKLPDGSRDFERPESLHLDEIRRVLMNIADGREFVLPKYDFKVGGRVEEKLHAPIPDGCVIIEGLHALNPAISGELPSECLLKIFVSVSTNLNGDGGRLISGRKIRFVRRMVRDSIYRAADAERTFGMWEEVLAAEDVYLYPYKGTADFAFDTFHTFELAVMRERAMALITPALAEREPYVMTVLDALSLVLPMDEALVPENSLIREFISGGIYNHLY